MEMRRIEMRVAPGVFSALGGRGDTRAYYLFHGDLSQMGTIYDTLKGIGLPVVQNDVYPGFRREDEAEYIEALSYLYTFRVDGWWNQERELVARKVCTQAEYDAALGRKPRPVTP